MRKSFALFITMILVSIFAVLSISIVETKAISTKIDTLKYLHLQAKIHQLYIKEYIKTHTSEQITTFSLSDTRFNVDIVEYVDNNQTTYHIAIQTIDDTTIRVCSTVTKN